MVQVRFEETPVLSDDATPYVYVEEHHAGKHKIVMGGGFTLSNMRQVAECLKRAARDAEFTAEIQEGL